MAQTRFRDRHDAGEQLAARLTAYAGRDDVVVLGLPRGGVPVAFEVARALQAPLDLVLVRKLGAPGHPEFAIGAIATGGVQVLSDDVIADLGISQTLVDQMSARERAELERREQAYHTGRAPVGLGGRVVVVVDDGLATGSTMEAAVIALRRQDPQKIVVAVPVGAADTCKRLSALADEVVCLLTPDPFSAVGLWYFAFDQTTDQEVVALLQQNARARGRSTPEIPARY